MYRHERSTTSDRPQSSHIAEKTAEKNVAAPISNQFALSRNITQLQSFGSDSDELHNKLTKRISSRRNNGLPAQLQNGIENLSGYSMDNVRVHYNSPRPARLQALAYAKGEDIFVAPGQEKHLPHEAWHIVQQKQGRAVPTGRVNGVSINDNPALEHEADVMGAKAVQLRAADGNAAVQLQRDIYPVIQLIPDSDPASDKSALTNYDILYEDLIGLKKTADPIETSELRGTIRHVGENYENSNKKLGNKKTVKYYNEIKDIWTSIVNAFFEKENIDAIINKMFSKEVPNLATDVESIKKNIDDVKKKNAGIYKSLLDHTKKSIVQTLTDIYYWNIRINFGKKVKAIQVTDSDPHTKGVGVCIVEFTNDDEKLVIKPDKKNFEKAVYGKSKDGKSQSLASVFNNITKDDDGQVGELGINTSNVHGSAVEYFKHKKFTEFIFPRDPNDKEYEQKVLSKIMESTPKGLKETIEKAKGYINERTLANTIALSSLLGLNDLHVENFVYGRDDGKAQLIDSETGGAYNMGYQENPDDLLATSVYKGSMMSAPGYLSRFDSIAQEIVPDLSKFYKNEYIDSLIGFLKEAKGALENLSCRLLIFNTDVLYRWRYSVYSNKMSFEIKSPDAYEDILRRTYERLYSKDIGSSNFQLMDVKKAYGKMINEFKKGIIPFYERYLSTGNVYQQFSDGIVKIISDPENSLDEFISRNVTALNNLKDKEKEKVKEETTVKAKEEAEEIVKEDMKDNNKLCKCSGIIVAAAAAGSAAGIAMLAAYLEK